jgi:hypothetical protein
LLVGRRICDVYGKEGECKGECGGVQGDGHRQAIDAKVSVVPDAEPSVATVKTSTFEKCIITGAINYVKS